jgi:hypothetical protein
MQMLPVHERLRQARLVRRDEIDALAERIGIRAAVLTAIEAGEYDKLPSGLYGRAAIRAYADALGFDSQAILDQCGALLTPLEDPIAGLARVRGMRAHNERSPHIAQLMKISALLVENTTSIYPNWRFLAASAIDSAIVFGLLLMLVATTISVYGTPVLSTAAAPAFAIVGVLLATTYFAFFGGIGGQTAGARLARVGVRAPSHTPLNLSRVMSRAVSSAARDVAVVEQMAAWVRGISASDRSSTNRRDRQRAEQPAR